MIFEFDGTKLYYETHGNTGRPLLLLHGWGGKCESWKPVIRDFENEYKLIVVDFPGHGRSSDPSSPWSVTEYARLITGLLDHLGIEEADIIGHSFGGRVAIVLSAERPKRVGRVVLTGTAGLIPERSWLMKCRKRLFSTFRKSFDSGIVRVILGARRADAIAEKLAVKFGSEDYRHLNKLMRKTFVRIVEQDLAPYLHKIAAPVTLVWGEADTETPLWMGHTMEREIPNAKLHVLPNCGHYAYLDRYSDFKIISKRFLARAEGTWN